MEQQLIGVWSRQSICIGKGEAYEDSQVIWLQTPTRYTDIRAPLDANRQALDSGEGSEAFAGRQLWQPQQLTFHHEMDYTGNYPEDEGVLSWDGETLVETGSVEHQGTTIYYEERWGRMTRQNPSFVTMEARGRDDALLAIEIPGGTWSLVEQSRR